MERMAGGKGVDREHEKQSRDDEKLFVEPGGWI
jgi:hypothetical protein